MEPHQVETIIRLLQQVVDNLSDLKNQNDTNNYNRQFNYLVGDIQRTHKDILLDNGSIQVNLQRLRLLQCADYIRQSLDSSCFIYRISPKIVYDDYKLGVDISIYLRKQVILRKDSYSLVHEIRNELVTNGRQAALQKVALLILEQND